MTTQRSPTKRRAGITTGTTAVGTTIPTKKSSTSPPVSGSGEKINNIINLYGEGYELSLKGEIVRLTQDGMEASSRRRHLKLPAKPT